MEEVHRQRREPREASARSKVPVLGGDDPVVRTRSGRSSGTLTSDAAALGRPSQIDQVLKFLHTPGSAERYDDPEQRIEDLKKLRGLGEQPRGSLRIPGGARARPAELNQGPRPRPGREGDKDALVLSTIHSAKGLEWDAVTRDQRHRWRDSLGPCDGVGRPARRGAPALLRRPDPSPDLADGHLSPLRSRPPGKLGRL